MAVYESTAYTLYKERRQYLMARDAVKKQIDAVIEYGPDVIDQYEARVNTLTKLLHSLDGKINDIKIQMNNMYGNHCESGD